MWTLAATVVTCLTVVPAYQSDGWRPAMAKGYVATHVAEPPKIDGRLDDVAWRAAEWSDAFVDIEGDVKPAPAFRTRVKMVWDDDCFYVAAELEEPHVWATLTRRDSVIFHDNDFELFVDPDGDLHNYYELEINALGTVWDLRLPKPYREGGQAVDEWDIAGLRSAVHIDGTLNDPSDVDRGWTVELAIPWAALGEFADVKTPPRDGDLWRINFSRVQWTTDVKEGRYVKREGLREANWVWSPQGVIDMHRPERWGLLTFSKGKADPAVAVDPLADVRWYLVRLHEAQKRYREVNGRWAAVASELQVEPPAGVPGAAIEPTRDGYEATVRTAAGSFSIRQDAKLTRK